MVEKARHNVPDHKVTSSNFFFWSNQEYKTQRLFIYDSKEKKKRANPHIYTAGTKFL